MKGESERGGREGGVRREARGERRDGGEKGREERQRGCSQIRGREGE